MKKQKTFEWPESWIDSVRNNLKDLPPAILLVGPEHFNLKEFSVKVSAKWLCKKTSTFLESCDCQSCSWCFDESHPDLKIVTPDEKGEKNLKSTSTKGEILINQIRDIRTFINLSSHQNGVRIACIGPANRLNFPAANALLKSLEEPNRNMHFILFANSLSGIPATILSRCRKIILPTSRKLIYLKFHENDVNLKWLIPLLRNGKNFINPVEMAKKAGKNKPADIIYILVRWMLDVARVKIGLRSICFPEEEEFLRKNSNNLRSLSNWIEAMIKIQDMIKYSNHSLNVPLFHETVFFEYLDGFN